MKEWIKWKDDLNERMNKMKGWIKWKDESNERMNQMKWWIKWNDEKKGWIISPGFHKYL